MGGLKCVLLLLATLQQFVLGSVVRQRFLNLASRADSGCGKTQVLPGVTQYKFDLKSSGKDRSYGYHLPSNYDKNKKYPVVVGFHGSSSIGLFFELDTKMSEERYSGDVSNLVQSKADQFR